MSENEITKRLIDCLSPPNYLCVFSEDLIRLDEVSKLIIKKGLQTVIGARKAYSFDNNFVYGIIYIREEKCWNDCMSKCGSEENLCFPRCFYDCLNETYIYVKNVLEEGGQKIGDI